MPGVTLQSVTKRFTGGAAAVDELSLDIADGEFMILVGSSGCGKTTALRMIAGLETPTAGTSVATGSAVALSVSLGPALVTVPNVVGQTQAAASSAITGAGLLVGAVTLANSATIIASRPAMTAVE